MSISKLEELTQTFRKGFPEKSTELSDLNNALAEASPPEQAYESIRDKCHFLKGAFGMYGFHEMYEYCEQIEALIASDSSAISKAEVSIRLQQLIEELNQHTL